MAEPSHDQFAKMFNPEPLLGESTSNSKNAHPIPELSAVEKRCLEHIEWFRDEVLKDRDHLAAALGYFASRNMEHTLRVDSDLHKLVATHPGPSYTAPGYLRGLSMQMNLCRQFQRDLSFRHRLKSSSPKATQSNEPLRPSMGINPAEKPR